VFLTCRQASELLSGRLDRTLQPVEMLRLRAHLALCKACRRVAEQLGFLHKAVSELPKVLHSD
jgi:predicted anti-sigma-YlaC factor YlaD